MDTLLGFCTCPDEACAERIATALVDERLAACVTRIAGVTSTYRWQGRTQHDREVLLLIKTTNERFDAVRERIMVLHPYELPEVIAVDVARGLPAYLDWVARETRA